MNRLRRTSEGGFTLIELLVVIAIIGILAAIAIPQFAAYRRRGYDADVKSNIKNAATAQEAYFVDSDTYTSAVGSLTGFNQSSNVTVSTVGTSTTFMVTGTVTSGCTASTGVWYISSTSGTIGGTPCG
jgi:type IV pilus assembly protein PilA